MQLKKNTIERRHAKKKKFRKKGLSPEHRAAENVIPPLLEIELRQQRRSSQKQERGQWWKEDIFSRGLTLLM